MKIPQMPTFHATTVLAIRHQGKVVLASDGQVTLGQTVGADTEVCLIEVMKLFTSVLAGVEGAVRKVLVEDAELVEYDQPLFLIEPT